MTFLRFQLSKCTTKKVGLIFVMIFYFSVLFRSTAPTKPPVITSLYFVNSTSLNIAWNAPADVDRHGFIRRFEIFVAKGNCSMDLPTTPTSKTSPEPTTTKTDDGLATEKPSTEPLRRRRRSIGCNFESRYNVPGKATHKLISDLKKWTIYSVYVVCWTVGPSHRSDINVSRTDEDSKYFTSLTGKID